MISALVLAAGKATRLAGIRDNWAKACVPVGDSSPLAFLLPRLYAAGVKRAWINLHYRPHQVREMAIKHAPAGLELCFLDEPELLGTGGTLSAICQQESLPDVIVNAKMFTDFNFESILKMPAPTLVLHQHSLMSEFGGFSYANNKINQLVPKGKKSPKASGVFMGICKPSAVWLEHLNKYQGDDLACFIRHGLIPAMQLNKEYPNALIHSGEWCEISTPARVLAAQKIIAQIGS